MMSYDDFWKKLAEGHANSGVTASFDSHLSGKAHGSDFERVRLLTQREREKRALQLPVPAGTKVSFTGGLGAVLGYEDPPVPGSTGEVVTVKSANGEITHHDGNVFVQWDDGKFRSINAVHLRKAGGAKSASDQQADKLEAEAEAAEDQAQADRAKADAERMKSASPLGHAHRAGKWARKNKEFGDDMDEAAREWVTRREDPDSEEGKAMEVAFILGWLGKPMPRMGSRHRMTPAEMAEALALRDRIRNRGRMPNIDPDEYPPMRGMEGPFRFRDGRILYYDPKEGEYYDRKADLYLYGDSRLAKKQEGDPCWEGYEMVGMKKNDKGRMVPNCVPEKNVKDKKARLRAASLGDLTEFLKVAEGTLIHKSTKDLWSFKKDADGMLQVERLFDDNGKPLKA